MCGRFDGVTPQQYRDLMAAVRVELSLVEVRVELRDRGLEAEANDTWFQVAPIFQRSAMLPPGKPRLPCNCGCGDAPDGLDTEQLIAASLRVRTRFLRLQGECRLAIIEAKRTLAEYVVSRSRRSVNTRGQE